MRLEASEIVPFYLDVMTTGHTTHLSIPRPRPLIERVTILGGSSCGNTVSVVTALSTRCAQIAEIMISDGGDSRAVDATWTRNILLVCSNLNFDDLTTRFVDIYVTYLRDGLTTGSMPSANIDILTIELLVQVLVNSPYRSLLACRLVNRLFRDIIDDSEALHFIIELGAAGYAEFLPRRCTTADALASFRKIQGIYRNPSLQRHHQVVDLRQYKILTEPALVSREWAQHNNNLIGQLCDRDDDGGIISIVDIIQLTSATPDRAFNRYRRLRFDGHCETLFIDPTQDLLVQVCRSTAKPTAPEALRFLSLQTGEPHERMVAAPDGILRLGHYWMILHLSLFGDWVLITPHHTVPQLGDVHLFHWPSGTRYRSWFNKRHYHSAMDGCILGDLLILPRYHAADASSGVSVHNTIDVYALPSSAGGQLTLLSVFELPNGVEDTCVIPFREQIMCRSASGFCPERALLRLLLDDDLFTVPISAFDPERWRNRGASAVGGKYPVRVSWEVWGPPSLHPCESEWIGDTVAVSGLRVIYRSFILDFNPLDAMQNIYGSRDTASHGDLAAADRSTVRSGVVEQCASTYHLRNKSYSVPTGPVYRQTPITLEQLFHGEDDVDLFLVEDVDGPKAVRLVLEAEVPVALYIWDL